MSFTNSQSRIKTPDELASLIEQAKHAGKTVITTNGVFDFIHAGHLAYLEAARAKGDMLVLAINTDASVQRIKGPGRPINSEQDRAYILAGLRCVDYVTFFDEETPEHILSILKPSLHAKGGDYTPEQMPETNVVREYGGDVVILPLREGYSNSKQFEKIRTSSDKGFQRADHLAGDHTAD